MVSVDCLVTCRQRWESDVEPPVGAPVEKGSSFHRRPGRQTFQQLFEQGGEQGPWNEPEDFRACGFSVHQTRRTGSIRRRVPVRARSGVVVSLQFLDEPVEGAHEFGVAVGHVLYFLDGVEHR